MSEIVDTAIKIAGPILGALLGAALGRQAGAAAAQAQPPPAPRETALPPAPAPQPPHPGRDAEIEAIKARLDRVEQDHGEVAREVWQLLGSLGAKSKGKQ